MSQKTNTNNFWVKATKNEWSAKYFEKNLEEYSLINYYNINLQKYLEQFLNKNGLIFKNCRYQINSKNFYLFISYFNTQKMAFSINKIIADQLIELRKIKNNFKSFDLDRLTLLIKYKRYLQNRKYANQNKQQKSFVFENLLESLVLFTNKKLNIFINFQNFNKGLNVRLSSKEKTALKTKLLLLKQFFQNKFFNESLNVIFLIVKIKNSAKILANFVTTQLEHLKFHNRFLILLKQILTLLFDSKLHKFKGIKIIIKGKLNCSLRSKKKLILIGKIPVRTLNKKIYYAEKTAYTKNGTFGVRIWVNQTKN